MDSSRDSSVWRSLAVTFGGGLALGAVGMKLTQNARRPGDPPPQPYVNPLADRLDQIEQHLKHLDHAPAAAPPPPATAPPPAFDQKVLEAVVNAVDARLREHNSQVERRIADLEATVTRELQILHKQDDTLAERAETRVHELRDHFQDQFAVVRAAVGVELNHFGEAVSTMVAEQVAQQVEARSADAERSLETRIVAAAAAAAAAGWEDRLAPLRAEVALKERELADVRDRLKESEQNVLEVILAIGAICRQAASRIGPSDSAPGTTSAQPNETPEPPPAPNVEPPETPPPPEMAAPAPPIEGLQDLEHVDDLEAVLAFAPPAIPPRPFLDPPPDTPLPGFAQPSKQSRLWRIPLMSSLVLATTGLLMLHYLS